jgi:hypothetical protein
VLVSTPWITSFNASSGRAEEARGDWTFAGTPLSAISRSNWSPESTKARRLFEAPHEDDSSFRADLEQSTPNRKPFMKFVSLTKPIAVPH